MARQYNPKRRIQSDPEQEYLKILVSRVKYSGSPYHKRTPGDFGLTPPVQPVPDKTLCDQAGVTTVTEASRLLKAGVKKGLISVQIHGEFPQNIWAVREDGWPFEAQLENQVQGTYHGYPMPSTDDFRLEVLKKWNQ